MSGVQIKIVGEDEQGMRLDRWFKLHFPQLRHGELEKCLRKGQIRVSGGRSKANRRLEAGEEIRVPPISDSEGKRDPAPRRLSENDAKFIRSLVIYEDDDVIAINKPAGLAVQGGTNTKRHVDGMLPALANGDERPRLVHRLDRDTSGLLVLARNRRAAQSLSDAFAQRAVEKTYWALVCGEPRPSEGTIKMPVEKQDFGAAGERMTAQSGPATVRAKPAITHYQLIDSAGGRASFVAMRPVTGRTHQLRVHASAIETPIVGDRKYGGSAAVLEGVDDALHLMCRSMIFRHPRTQKLMTLSASLSGHMAKTWKFFGFETDIDVQWPEGL